VELIDALNKAKYIVNGYGGADWSVQGFGMMRTYLDEKHEWRLHIWDNRLRNPAVSAIHNHPWSFQSWILSGSLINQRYARSKHPHAEKYKYGRIKCGENAYLLGEPEDHYLIGLPQERYITCQTYSQLSFEIHQTFGSFNAITLVKREFLLAPAFLDVADCYWKEGPWVDAAPRPATSEEIEKVLGSHVPGIMKV
jgi:hypothetical protein